MNAKRFTVAGLLLAVPVLSWAHSPIQGIGVFYNGLLHPVFVPAHLLLLVAVGLFLGRQASKEMLTGLGVFSYAVVSGLSAAWFSIAIEAEVLILFFSAAVSLLVAVSPKVNLLWCSAIGLLAGLFLGIDSAQEELSGQDKFVSLFGSAVTIYLLLLSMLAVSHYLNRKRWQKIGIRIVGSWVAASSLLVLVLLFSPQA